MGNSRRHFQRGQAMMEYMTLLPAGIMIAIGATIVLGFLVNSFSKTVEGITQPAVGYGLPCEVQEAPPPDVSYGPSIARLGDHTVELVAVVYNPSDNTTTVKYTVTSGTMPTISHWVLGIPKSVADEIVWSSEKYEKWAYDPRTQHTGIKFDIGYETASINPNGRIMLTSYSGSSLNSSTTVTRDITLLISGQYDFGSLEVAVAVKAGTDTYVEQISTPVYYHDRELDETCD